MLGVPELTYYVVMENVNESRTRKQNDVFFCHKISKDALKNIVTTVSMSGCRAKRRLG